MENSQILKNISLGLKLIIGHFRSAFNDHFIKINLK